MLYGSILPDYSSKLKDDDKGKKDGKKNSDGIVIKADDPKNKNEVFAILHGYKF